MSAQEKSEVLARVEGTRWGKRRLLAQLQVPRSTYYRWRAMERQGKQECPAVSTRVPWTRLSLPEEAAVLAAARESPEGSSRQLATWITDHLSLSVGESTVYRLLKLEEGRADQTSRDATPGWQRVPAKDRCSTSDVGYRRFVFQSDGVGLLLHGHRDGRLLPVHLGLEAATGHDI